MTDESDTDFKPGDIVECVSPLGDTRMGDRYTVESVDGMRWLRFHERMGEDAWTNPSKYFCNPRRFRKVKSAPQPAPAPTWKATHDDQTRPDHYRPPITMKAEDIQAAAPRVTPDKLVAGTTTADKIAMPPTAQPIPTPTPEGWWPNYNLHQTENPPIRPIASLTINPAHDEGLLIQPLTQPPGIAYIETTAAVPTIETDLPPGYRVLYTLSQGQDGYIRHVITGPHLPKPEDGPTPRVMIKFYMMQGWPAVDGVKVELLIGRLCDMGDNWLTPPWLIGLWPCTDSARADHADAREGKKSYTRRIAGPAWLTDTSASD